MKKEEYKERVYKYREILKKQPRWYETADQMQNKQQKELLAETNQYVLAPMLCDFVLWILKTALQKRKKQIYFLARDGYQLYHIAETLCERLELPIQCSYVYCSRYALRRAEYVVSEKEVLDYLCLDGISVTLETIFKRAGIIDRKEQNRFAVLWDMQDYLTENVEENRQLGYTVLQELKQRMAACKPFLDYLAESSAAAYETVIGYLRQEGFFDEKEYLLADSGWSGTMQRSFRKLLESAGYKGKIEGCYFGLYEYPRRADRKCYHTYYFCPESDLKRKIYFNNNVFECICTSPEGMCIGYEKKEVATGETRYVPILSETRNPNADKVSVLKECLKEYVNVLLRNHKEELRNALFDENQAGCNKILEKLLSLFMGNPTTAEAEAYGSYVFCDDVVGDEDRYLAASLTMEELKKNRLWHQIVKRYMRTKKGCSEGEERIKGSAWIEASIASLLGKNRRSLALHKELFHCRNVKRVRYIRKQLKFKKHVKNL